jgi:hypothetical protein
MTGSQVNRLSNDYLAGLAAGQAQAADPHRLLKESGKRQVQAILAVCRHQEQRPASVDLAKIKVAELEQQVESAKDSYFKTWQNRSLSDGAQADLQAISRLEDELRSAKDDLKNQQNAIISREERGLGGNAA